MTRKWIASLLVVATLGLGSGGAQADQAFRKYDWASAYADFRDAVLAGDSMLAASIGDGFIDQAAQDLNHHNPDFGRLALEVGSAHHRAESYERAIELVGKAQAAFQFALGYESRESFDALALLADVTLDSGDYDGAIDLYEEGLVVALVGDFIDDIPARLAGLAETYDQIDPRIAEAIRNSKLYPTDPAPVPDETAAE